VPLAVSLQTVRTYCRFCSAMPLQCQWTVLLLTALGCVLLVRLLAASDALRSGAGPKAAALASASLASALQLPQPAVAPNPLSPEVKHVFFLRTFAGDRGRAVALPSFLAFLDLTRFHLVIVLDEESPEDASWAQELQRTFAAYMPQTARGGVHIGFARAPSGAVLALSPYAGHPQARYYSAGYTRMLFDTLLLDAYLPPGRFGPHDIVHIMDADSPLNAVFVPTPALFPGGRIAMPLHPAADHFPGDGMLLHTNTGTLVDTMWGDTFPQPVRVSTFGALRTHLARLWNSSTTESKDAAAVLEGVWLAAALAQPLCPINVLLNFGLAHQPALYTRLTAHAGLRAVPIFAHNRPYRRFLLAGCCRAFSEPKAQCLAGSGSDEEHLTFVNNLDPALGPPFDDASAVVDETYQAIYAYLAAMPYAQRLNMGNMCRRLTEWSANLPETHSWR
jgi:hypothetical protein